MIAKEVFKKQLNIIAPILAKLELDFIKEAKDLDRAMYKATKKLNTVPTVELRDLELKIKTCNVYQRLLQKLKWQQRLTWLLNTIIIVIVIAHCW